MARNSSWTSVNTNDEYVRLHHSNVPIHSLSLIPPPQASSLSPTIHNPNHATSKTSSPSQNTPDIAPEFSSESHLHISRNCLLVHFHCHYHSHPDTHLLHLVDTATAVAAAAVDPAGNMIVSVDLVGRARFGVLGMDSLGVGAGREGVGSVVGHLGREIGIGRGVVDLGIGMEGVVGSFVGVVGLGIAIEKEGVGFVGVGLVVARVVRSRSCSVEVVVVVHVAAAASSDSDQAGSVHNSVPDQELAPEDQQQQVHKHCVHNT